MPCSSSQEKSLPKPLSSKYYPNRKPSIRPDRDFTSTHRSTIGKNYRIKKAKLSLFSDRDVEIEGTKGNDQITRQSVLSSELSVRSVTFFQDMVSSGNIPRVSREHFTTKDFKALSLSLERVVMDGPIGRYIDDLVAFLSREMCLGGLMVAAKDGVAPPTTLSPASQKVVNDWLKDKLHNKFHESYSL